MKNAARAIEEDLKIAVGVGATMHVGSDSYAYWITEVCPNGVIGICSANSHFDDKHPWEGGVEVVEPFDADKDKTKTYIKRCYGTWWTVTKDGKRLSRFSDKWRHFSIGHALAYRDPSF